ncbi:MAG: phosphogluconate dehydratase [Propionibacteriaceae bacterium]|nr:phosphogluconate dehydratase [Propionibacteriaceae bacterium]
MTPAPLSAVVAEVTQRIRQRSRQTRQAYLERIRADAVRADSRERLSCANLAHAFAALDDGERKQVIGQRRPNLGIVTSYNDLLSAHRPYEDYPKVIRDEARDWALGPGPGATPAMCDGVTQGTPGMELSLFSRDVIAMSTAVALSHDVFDAVLLLGICDKIVPGLLIGALSAGHLPCVFVPAGPMGSGIANSAKAKVREAHVRGEASREQLLDVEQQAYHGVGTCTFYGTANSNQVLLEAMGLHVPGAAFVPPYSGLREQLTRGAVRTALEITRERRFTPIGELVDERVIVNALVTLLATGGSTNHLIHWVAVARAAGISFDWSDVDRLSGAVPLLARIYPNGQADINDFERAGGTGFVLAQLLELGLLHPDVATVSGEGVAGQTRRPRLVDGELSFTPPPSESPDPTVLRPAAEPFDSSGGLALLTGNLGRSVIKVSAVAPDHRVVTAPAFVADSQEEVVAAFSRGELDRDVVVVVRFQGPRANGMPELHRLTAILGSLQSAGRRVALVTDGRMSGASGRIPAAIHLTPEASAGGPCARLRSGDLIRLDTTTGSLEVLLDANDFATRQPAQHAVAGPLGLGRDIFAGLRATVGGAEQGACTWLPDPDQPVTLSVQPVPEEVLL